MNIPLISNMLIKVRHKGSFNNIERFFNRVLKRDYLNILSDYAAQGVEALREYTPVDTGLLADSWGFEIESGNGITTIWFTNDDIENGQNVAILLLYGHGTRNGGYVEGVDFVSPALQPIFQDLADTMWREVTE